MVWMLDCDIIIAECLSTRQLILLRISFCICMYICPSCVGVLIFCMRCAPAVLSGVRAASLVPRPSRPPTNIMYDYFYSAQKAGRSG